MTHVPAYNAKKDAKIKAIITDLGGVIVKVDKSPMCREFAKYSSLSAEEICSHFSSTKFGAAELDFGRGLVTPEEFFESVTGKFRIKGLSFKAFTGIYTNIFTLKEDVLSALSKLTRNYTLALLSNTDSLHYSKWSRLLGKDMQLFKELVLSFDVHSIKPEPEIYLEAAKRLGVKPQHCVFIDDVEEYVEAARKLGMRGIRFTSAGQLQRDLKKFGVAL